MSFCDISEEWQKQPFSDQNPLLYPNLFDKLTYAKPVDPLSGELEFQLQDDPFHSYKPDARPDESMDMLAEYPKECLLQDCFISNITSNTFINQDSDSDANIQSGQLSEAESTKRSKNSTTKNILGYQTKKVIKMMFAHHTPYLTKKCKSLGLVFREFKKYYLSAEKKLYGPVSLDKLFKIDPENPKEAKMKELFLKVFNKILRKEYLIYSLRLGKMQDQSLYIREKNDRLLYYSERRQML